MQYGIFGGRPTKWIPFTLPENALSILSACFLLKRNAISLEFYYPSLLTVVLSTVIPLLSISFLDSHSVVSFLSQQNKNKIKLMLSKIEGKRTVGEKDDKLCAFPLEKYWDRCKRFCSCLCPEVKVSPKYGNWIVRLELVLAHVSCLELSLTLRWHVIH